jgi:hypothetical protein
MLSASASASITIGVVVSPRPLKAPSTTALI